MPKIEFIREEENSPEKLFIDGIEAKGWKILKSLPNCSEDDSLIIEVSDFPDFYACYHGNVECSFTPQTIREACIVLKNELEKPNSPVRAAFKASIKSAIDEAPNYTNMDKLSERILERIIGDERKTD